MSESITTNIVDEVDPDKFREPYIFIPQARIYGNINRGATIPPFDPVARHTYDITESGTIVLDYKINRSTVDATNYNKRSPGILFFGYLTDRRLPPQTGAGGSGGYVLTGDGAILYDNQLYKHEQYSESLPKIEVYQKSPAPKKIPGQEQSIGDNPNPTTGTYKAPEDAKYQSFAGADIVAEIVIPGEGPMTLGELQTISYSIHRENSPVRTLGHVNPRGFVKGPRTIGGSLIFTNFNSYAFYRIGRYLDTVRTHKVFPVADMLPPFDVVLTFFNEYGLSSRLRILGITIVDEGGTMSIDDLITESTMTYMARGIKPLTSISPGILLKGATFTTGNNNG